MVTPLRDGMNLVAKEFVAAQDPEDPGVLLLSQFAGAAAEMGGGALMVNPHEVEGVASALRRALEMPLAERRDRHARMMTVLNTNTIDHWAQNFLDALTDPPALDALLSTRSNGLRPSAPACLMDWQGLHRAQDL